jgi:aldehyde dehydrogenase (NAD+)
MPAVKEAFLTALRARIARAYGSGPASPIWPDIVTTAHAARLSALIADAVQKGARCRPAPGWTGRPSHRPASAWRTITARMRLSREEIFGPILPILAYDRPRRGDCRDQCGRQAAGALYLRPRPGPASTRIITQGTTSGAVGST